MCLCVCTCTHTHTHTHTHAHIYIYIYLYIYICALIYYIVFLSVFHGLALALYVWSINRVWGQQSTLTVKHMWMCHIFWLGQSRSSCKSCATVLANSANHANCKGKRCSPNHEPMVMTICPLLIAICPLLLGSAKLANCDSSSCKPSARHHQDVRHGGDGGLCQARQIGLSSQPSFSTTGSFSAASAYSYVCWACLSWRGCVQFGCGCEVARNLLQVSLSGQHWGSQVDQMMAILQHHWGPSWRSGLAIFSKLQTKSCALTSVSCWPERTWAKMATHTLHTLFCLLLYCCFFFLYD